MFSIFFMLLPNGGGRKQLRRILHEPARRSPRHVCSIFSAKYRRSDLPVLHLKQNLANILDSRLEPRNLKEISHVTHCYEQKPSFVNAVFER